MIRQRAFGVFLFFVLAAGFAGCAGRGGPGMTAIQPNSIAPDFTLVDLTGKPVRMSQFKGKVVVLDFWATWCPPCRREIPQFNELYNRDQTKGVVVLGVALDPEGSSVVRPFADENKINYPILIGNSNIQKAYGGIQSIPTTFIINKEGKVASSFVGYQELDAIEKRIQALL